MRKVIRWIWIILALAAALFMLLRGQYYDAAATLARTQVMRSEGPSVWVEKTFQQGKLYHKTKPLSINYA